MRVNDWLALRNFSIRVFSAVVGRGADSSNFLAGRWGLDGERARLAKYLFSLDSAGNDAYRRVECS